MSASIEILPMQMKHRTKCRILAAVDLVWRVSDLIFVSILSQFPKSFDESGKPVLKLSYSGESYVLKYEIVEVMDGRVYDFIFSPILTLLYFIAFFFQISSSIFLFKASNGKSLVDERAACIVWSRIGILSMIIIIIRFFLPYAIISLLSVSYNLSRFFFKIYGIFIVLQHAQELVLLIDESAKESQVPPLTNVPKKPYDDLSEEEVPKSEFYHSKTAQINFIDEKNDSSLSYARPRVHRALLHLDKKNYDKAIEELKIAQKYGGDDVFISQMLNIVLKIQRSETEKSEWKNYYKILGVSKNLTFNEIKVAYRRKSLRHHPDKHFTSSEKVINVETKLYQEIREAYDVLSDPIKREEYDGKKEKMSEKIELLTSSFKNIYTQYDSQFLSSIV